MKKETRLYNVIFPFWMLILFPAMWFVILPANFAIDSLVLFVAMRFLKLQDKKQIYKNTILKVFAFGMLSDIIGAALMYLMLVLELSQTADELYFTIPAMIISAILIFVFDYFFSFKKLEKPIRFKLALIFAVVTAPYTFLIPTEWMY